MAILWFVLFLLATAAAGALLTQLLAAKKLLGRYATITNAEAYRAQCECASQAALAEQQRLRTESTGLQTQIAEQKSTIARYQQVLGHLKTAAELRERIQSDTARVQQLGQTLGVLNRIGQLDAHIRQQEAAITQRANEFNAYGALIGQARTSSELAAQIQYHTNLLAQLKSDIEAVEEAGQLQEFGFYRPRFEFASVEEYSRRLEATRSRQKAMLKSNQACACAIEWTVDGSKREGAKMVSQQIKLMLRAFNGECDAAVAKVKYNNVVSLENRMRKSFEAINKLGETKKVQLASPYLQLKLDELHLAHEHQERKEEEREEQRRIREAMKEEAKVLKEIEQAKIKAERDEHAKAAALEKARQELAARHGEQTEKLERLVSKLERELKDAIDRKAKAIARAQLTKSGHVYILSNIGAFGEGVFKIGLTRRLDPLERVRELGSASVPFPFDVHAVIYSEDAPALEAKLHRFFHARRVNLVNQRREFFRATLDEVRAAVADNYGHISFILMPEAAEYRKTCSLIKEAEQRAPNLQIA